MLIAGNWKMNTTTDEAVELAQGVVRAVSALQNSSPSVDVAVCPPFTNLGVVASILKGSDVRLGAQNMHHMDAGAYTGEVSAAMLQSVGCRYVILGHSERRQYFCETDQTVNEKAQQALQKGLVPIICIGETLEQREQGKELSVIGDQLAYSLRNLEVESGDQMVIAYEPVWAIGTGKTARPDQAQDIHAFIRGGLMAIFDKDIADNMHILYGGSMKPGNARELLDEYDIDGGLIGGASLKPDDFAAIVAAALEVQT